ncbi:hypothetical protein PanWU01x14_081680, partial [Parasponia andersonii]
MCEKIAPTRVHPSQVDIFTEVQKTMGERYGGIGIGKSLETETMNLMALSSY